MLKNKYILEKYCASKHNNFLSGAKKNTCIKWSLALTFGLCTCLASMVNITSSYATESIQDDLYPYENSAYKNSTSYRAPISQKIYGAPPIKQSVMDTRQSVVPRNGLAVNLNQWRTFTSPTPNLMAIATPRLTAAPSTRANNHVSWGNESGSGNHSVIDVTTTGHITMGAGKHTAPNTSHTITNSTLTANNNTLSTPNGNIVLYGGYASAHSSHNVSGNTINISNGSNITGKSHYYRAGYANGNGSHTLTNNAIIIDGSEVHTAKNGRKQFFGAQATGNGNHILTGNSIRIHNGSTIDTTATGNQGDNVNQIIGSYSNGVGNHTHTGNMLSVESGSTLIGSKILYNGWANNYRKAGSHMITDNHILIKDSTLNTGSYSNYNAFINGYARGNGSHVVDGNTITLDNATLRGGRAFFYSGIAYADNGNHNHNVSNGATNIKGSDIYIQQMYLFNSYTHSPTGNHSITNTAANISDSKVKTNYIMHIFGGYGQSGTNHTMKQNVLNITGSQLQSVNSTINMWAGYAVGTGNHSFSDGHILFDDSTALADRNNITLNAAHAKNGVSHTMDLHTIRIANKSALTAKKTNITVYGGYAKGTGNHSITNSAISVDDSSLNAKNLIDITGGYAETGVSHTMTGHIVSVANNSNLTSTNNKITIYGGHAKGTGDHAINNSTLAVDKSIVQAHKEIDVTGAYAETGTSHTMTGHIVSVANDSTLTSTTDAITIYGGHAKGSGNHSITGSTIAVDGSKLNANKNIDITGGYAETGANHTMSGHIVSVANNSNLTSTNNKITIYGGHAKGSGSHSINNSAIAVNGSKLNAELTIDITGGYAETGAAHTMTGHTVSVASGSELNSTTGEITIYGGYAKGSGSHSINASTINVEGSNLKAATDIDITGGYAETVTTRAITITATAGTARTGATHTLEGHTVNITDSTLDSDGKVTVYGGHAVGSGTHSITGSTLLVENTTINAPSGAIELAGGRSESSTNSTITGSDILISNGSKINSTATGDISIYGGHATSTTGTHTITDNSIVIDNASIIAPDTHINIIGGYSEGANSTITGNTITIKNESKINSMGNNGDIYIYGGYATGTGIHAVTNNTITFENLPLHSIDAEGEMVLAGGMINGTGTGDVYSGNTLHINQITVDLTDDNTTNSTVKNFENYEFTLSAGRDQSTPMLLANHIQISELPGGKGRNANLKLRFASGAPVIALGSKFNIMQADTHDGAFANIDTVDSTIGAAQGISLSYDFRAYVEDGDVSDPNKTLYLEVLSVQSQEQTKIPAEAQAASMAFLNQGADLVSGLGMESLLERTKQTDTIVEHELEDSRILEETTFEPRFASFSAFTSGNSRYNTGSHSDINGYSLLTGLGTRFMFDSGDFIFGVFFEYGKASINTHNTFDFQPSVDGEGDSEYTGGGILARYDHYSGLYAEASARTGMTNIDYGSNEYFGMGGEYIGYSMHSPYYGAHIGLGFNWELFGNGNLDISSKYFYTQQKGGDVTLSGDAFTFKDVESSRVRGGLNYSHEITEYLIPYIGAAWEYEFNGYANSETQKISTEAPTLRGGTAIFDAGITLRANTKIPLSLDIGIEAYTGMRQGVAGKVQFIVAF